MNIAEALGSLLPPSSAVVAIVGGGGKTSALFALAEALAERSPTADVLITTTTHLVDPRTEDGRTFDQFLLDPALAEPASPSANGAWELTPPRPDRGRRAVLAATVKDDRLQGLHPSQVDGLCQTWPFILIEADGSRRRPIKAPAGHEPVVPLCADLVVGVIGLDCLGRPMDEKTVHRPERFGPLAGCAPGAPILVTHLAALCRAPEGLFKGAPPRARRVLLLNKADLCVTPPGDLLRELKSGPDLGVDRILVCALGNSDPEARVLAQD
jgi:probable selenium-dependent hydroxylase accessory protein YqeC